MLLVSSSGWKCFDDGTQQKQPTCTTCEARTNNWLTQNVAFTLQDQTSKNLRKGGHCATVSAQGRLTESRCRCNKCGQGCQIGSFGAIHQKFGSFQRQLAPKFLFGSFATFSSNKFSWRKVASGACNLFRPPQAEKWATIQLCNA